MKIINKSKINIINQYLNNYYPYIILFVLLAVLHSFMGFCGDDLTFIKQTSEQSIMNYLFYRYHHWTSRIIIDAVDILLLKQNVYIWAFLDCIIYTVSAFYINKIVNKKQNRTIAILGVLLILMYPFYELHSAGWATTSLNYLWAFSLGLISFIPLINKSYGETTSILGYLLAIFGLIFSTNQEQCCLLILGFNLLYLFNSIIQKKDISKYNIFAILISMLAFGIFLTCPGNASRLASEVHWLPEFVNYGISEKIYLGTIPTINLFLSDKIIFPLFFIFASICTFFKTKYKFFKTVSIFNIGFILLLTIFRPILLSIFPSLNQIFIRFATTGAVPPMNDIFTFLAIIISFYLIISSCVMIYTSFDKNLFPPILFIAGFMSKLIIGFSPTIFPSSGRATLFFYMILIMLILMLIKKLFEENIINERWEFGITAAFIILTVFNYMTTAIYIIQH